MERKRQMFAAFGKLLLFLLFNKLMMNLRNIYWWLTGRASQISIAQANYETSGHKMGIAYKHIIDLMFIISKNNFGLYHEGFVHPDYVLRDEVTLLQLTQTEAIFVESHKYMPPPFASRYSFFLNGQYETANKIITMPLASFFRLAQEMKGDGGKVVYLYNQSRCGSTLLTSIFEHTERCIALSEPQPLNEACRQVLEDNRWSKEEGNRLVAATVRILCKPYKGNKDKVLAYVIKPDAPLVSTADLLQEVAPGSVPFFMYRNPTAVGQSLRRIGEALPSLKMMYYLLEFKFANVVSKVLSVCGLVTTAFDGFSPKSGTGLEFGYFLAMCMLSERNAMAKKGISIAGIKFEDLRAKPKEMITQIFEACDLPDSLIAPALEAMKKDSQSATAINQEALNRLMPKAPKPTPAFVEEMRAENRKMDVAEPEAWDDPDYHIPNSITP